MELQLEDFALAPLIDNVVKTIEPFDKSEQVSGRAEYAIERFEVLLCCLGILPQHLAHPDNGVQRRAQLVAHVGKELRLVLARLRKLPALVLDFVKQPHVLDCNTSQSLSQSGGFGHGAGVGPSLSKTSTVLMRQMDRLNSRCGQTAACPFTGSKKLKYDDPMHQRESVDLRRAMRAYVREIRPKLPLLRDGSS